jgi:hypothetical protein
MTEAYPEAGDFYQQPGNDASGDSLPKDKKE